ncbi:uncharacterized protein EAE97_007472 [Botrytis byssoidea]|uniref:NAD(P)-binding protein n=1 Tax=Botrytis byssoidea TaxID=139641 RepID=A0A9P5INT2_9HELO|nr:uncharacterized protein EAE97_007472 [Botrytis byssoidea]KAF7939392.1 hypothetical protein EAE97_007472 [Botrytis byssoidea]
MAPNTVYLTTGANRGIGFGIVSISLQHANTTVVVTVRNETTDVAPFKALSKADNSDLIITYLSISTTSTREIETSHRAFAGYLKARDIEMIDVLVANAGIDTPLSSIANDFCANTLGPIALYQTGLPFLRASTIAKFVIIGSILGSIGAVMPRASTLSCGASKDAVHYSAKRIHDEEEMIVLTIHPGGSSKLNYYSIGVPAPPMTVEQSAEGVLTKVRCLSFRGTCSPTMKTLKEIDTATKEMTSGAFAGFGGAEVPW